MTTGRTNQNGRIINTIIIFIIIIIINVTIIAQPQIMHKDNGILYKPQVALEVLLGSKLHSLAMAKLNIACDVIS